MIAVYWHPVSLPIWWYLRAIRLPTSAIRGRFTRSGIAARRQRDRSRHSRPESAATIGARGPLLAAGRRGPQVNLCIMFSWVPLFFEFRWRYDVLQAVT